MHEPLDSPNRPWAASPSAKVKTSVGRLVTALLDELAPERVLLRAASHPGAVEQYRTPTGCVLQAAHAALSVSWFAEPSEGAALGELHVISWRGTVTRRGSTKKKGAADIVAEVILRPIEPAVDDSVWVALDGTRYSTASLTAKCQAMLESENRAET